MWQGVDRYGAGGSGTVHHIAFDTPSDESQLEVREKIAGAVIEEYERVAAEQAAPSHVHH